MHIKPISKLSREEIRDLARAAADRGQPLAEANVCEPDTADYKHFEFNYLERSCALAGDDG